MKVKCQSQTQGNVASRHLHRCSIFLVLGKSMVCFSPVKETTGPAPKCLLALDPFLHGLLGPMWSTEFGRKKGMTTKKALKFLCMSAVKARFLLGLSCGCYFAKWSEVVKQLKFHLFLRNLS